MLQQRPLLLHEMTMKMVRAVVALVVVPSALTRSRFQKAPSRLYLRHGDSIARLVAADCIALARVPRDLHGSMRIRHSQQSRRRLLSVNLASKPPSKDGRNQSVLSRASSLCQIRFSTQTEPDAGVRFSTKATTTTLRPTAEIFSRSSRSFSLLGYVDDRSCVLPTDSVTKQPGTSGLVGGSPTCSRLLCSLSEMMFLGPCSCARAALQTLR